MKPNFTEEEARTPVTFGDMAVLIKEIFNTIAANKEVEDQVLADSIGKVTDLLIEQIREVEYRRIRDAKFCISLFRDLTGMPQNKLEEHYMKWCEEFDRLNKKEKQV